MGIKDNLSTLLKSMPSDVQIVATSKTHPDESILEAYSIGQRIFGENKVQELVGKYDRLPKDIEWHFIGHLQTNKIRQIVPFVTLIHGVDSIKVLDEINRQAENIGRKVDCLLQVHIAKEESKFGFSQDAIIPFFENKVYQLYGWVNIVGLMGMATNSDDTQLVSDEFTLIKTLFDKCKQQVESPSFTILSMGMSGDYKIAIERGGNLLRIGSLIFGERDYH